MASFQIGENFNKGKNSFSFNLKFTILDIYLTKKPTIGNMVYVSSTTPKRHLISFASIDIYGISIRFPSRLQAMFPIGKLFLHKQIQTYYQHIIFNIRTNNNNNKEWKSHNFGKKTYIL